MSIGIFMPAAGRFGGKPKSLVLIDRTQGTNRGDLTSGGGLASMFDGNTNQPYTSAAWRSGTNAWAGKSLVAARCFGKATIYGANNLGYAQSVGTTVTASIRGKIGAVPSGRTDGTLIGQIVFSNLANESVGRDIDSTDISTAWDHLWLDLAVSGGSTVIAAELILYAWE